MPGIELGARELRQRAEREFQVFMRVQRAILVLREEFSIALGKGLAINGAGTGQELSPFCLLYTSPSPRD